jgi:glyoxylase-like metal-dependent hydrolase (beta-lactamase superfamily II)
MFFRQIYDSRLAQAAYLIGCQRTGEAIVVDPERDIDRYVDLARQNGLRIVAVAETHIHADYLSGAREIAEALGAAWAAATGPIAGSNESNRAARIRIASLQTAIDSASATSSSSRCTRRATRPSMSAIS